ncbi:histone methylation DOT1, partial [Mycena filopes]
VVRTVHLKERSLFLDLGSGVGNIVMQVSLQTGCRGYGIELRPPVAALAHSLLTNFLEHCGMWGLRAGQIDLEQDDICLSRRLPSLLSQADLVLVNNKAFEQPRESHSVHLLPPSQRSFFAVQ